MGNLQESIVKKKPPKKKSWLRHLRLVVVALAVLGVVGVVAYRAMFPPEKEFVLNYFTYSQVGTRDFAVNVTAGGTVIPENQATLRAPAAASVLSLMVQEGDDVVEGTLLVQLTSATLDANLASAQRTLENADQDLAKVLYDQEVERTRLERDLARAQENLAEKQVDFELKEIIFSYGGISRREFDKAQADVSDAQESVNSARRTLDETLRRHEIALNRSRENVREAQENLANVQENMKSLAFYAPFTGRVVELNVAQGADVANNGVLMTIANVASPLVRVQLGADVIDLISLGHEATIRTSFNTYQGTVTYIAPRAVEVGGNTVVETHLRFKDAVTELRPSSAVTVDIEVGRRIASPFLPRGAYLSSGEQMFVYVLQDGMAIRREVRYGMIGSTAVEVTSGLQPGDLVITSSYDEFRHLSQVRVNEEGGRRQ